MCMEVNSQIKPQLESPIYPSDTSRPCDCLHCLSLSRLHACVMLWLFYHIIVSIWRVVSSFFWSVYCCSVCICMLCKCAKSTLCPEIPDVILTWSYSGITRLEILLKVAVVGMLYVHIIRHQYCVAYWQWC